MSKHWKPGPASRWTRIGGYSVARGRFGGGGAAAALWLIVLGAVVLGLGIGAVMAWPGSSGGGAPDAPIEWNEVQAVPRRAPDAQDAAWLRRGAEASVGERGAGETERPSTSSGRAGSGQAGSEQTVGAVRAAHSTRSRQAFGYCRWGGGANCVVDGDTFWIGGAKVRIAGIDAPETHPSRCVEEARLGKAATERLHDLLNSGAVTMTGMRRDRDVYGRLLRDVAVDGVDVGGAMVSAGVARDYGHGRRGWC